MGLKELNELTPKQYSKVVDMFKVRCFRVIYKLNNEIKSNTERFVISIAATSDSIIDLNKLDIFIGFCEWYNKFFKLRSSKSG